MFVQYLKFRNVIKAYWTFGQQKKEKKQIDNCYKKVKLLMALKFRNVIKAYWTFGQQKKEKKQIDNCYKKVKLLMALDKSLLQTKIVSVTFLWLVYLDNATKVILN